MSWTDLEPIVKIVPRVQAAIYVNKDCKPRIRLTLSESFLNDTGHPKKADVQFGMFEGVAKIRMTFGGKGKFEIGDLGKGGARISNIPAREPLPDGHREAEACEVELANKSEVILILPLEAWGKQIEPPRPQPAMARNMHALNGHVETRKSPDLPLTERGKFDAVAYLSRKGVKISRKGDGYMIDGEMNSKAGTLVMVNRYRRAAELPDLKLIDIE